MEKEVATRSSSPFTPPQRSRLLLSLPDHLTQMVFDSLSTKHAAILSSVNVQLRDFALSHTPASWHNITIELKNAEKLKSLLIFLTKVAPHAKSFELFIDTNFAIDINALHLFPALPNVRRLILSRNHRWLECEHLELLANRMPAVAQLEIDGCYYLRASDECLDIVDRHYGRQLSVFSCAMVGLGFEPRNKDAMVRLMSHSSNMIKFNNDLTYIIIPNPVLGSMLDRSPDIQELICQYILADADTQTFLFALSSCRQLTYLNFGFHALGSATPVKPWALRAAFGGLTKLKILDLCFGHNVLMEPEDGESEGQGQNFPFQLNSLHVVARESNILYPFFCRLVVSQIEHLDTLTLNAPDFTDMFTDLFTQPMPRLRRLSISDVDYSSAHFTPPEAGYLHILNRTPSLKRLSAETMTNPLIDTDDEEIPHLLAREYPHCNFNIDGIKLSAERRPAGSANK